jgi:hypothetical protein
VVQDTFCEDAAADSAEAADLGAAPACLPGSRGITWPKVLSAGGGSFSSPPTPIIEVVAMGGCEYEQVYADDALSEYPIVPPPPPSSSSSAFVASHTPGKWLCQQEPS